MKIIAHIETDFPEKFGVPRQSGLIPQLQGKIIFEKKYRSIDAVRGLEDFSHLWLLWKFEGVEKWSPTVRPPRLGGNKRVGVFATRSPFRPNPIGLSSVKLERIEYTQEFGPVIIVSGIDVRNNTPIYDIKPYLAYVDSHPEAMDGFAAFVKDYSLEVECEETFLKMIPLEKREALLEVLRQDPRPAYQEDPMRVYGVSFAGFDVKFKVFADVLTVVAVDKH